MRADAGVQIFGFYLAPACLDRAAAVLQLGAAAGHRRGGARPALAARRRARRPRRLRRRHLAADDVRHARDGRAPGLRGGARRGRRCRRGRRRVAALHEAPRELRAPCPRCTPTAGSNTRTAATPTLSLCVRALPDLSASTAQSLRAALHAASNTCVCRHSSENEPAQAWRRINRCAPFPRPRPARATLVWHPSVRFGKLGSFGFAGFLRGEKTAAPERSNALKMLPLAQERWAGGAAALWR